MAFVAGAVGRGAAGKAAGSAAAKSGGKLAAGSAGKAAGDKALAEEVAAFNRQSGATPAAKPSPEPAAPPAAGSGGSPSGSSSKPKSSGPPPVKALSGALSDDSGTPAWFKKASKASSPTYALNAGGGAVLGCMAWVVGLTYLRDGGPGVKRWFRAKFFNQVEGS